MMFSKIAFQLNEVEYQLGTLFVQVHTGQISYSVGNEKMQELIVEKERLWALERSLGV